MSETELSVICKNCGSEVSPYVTECPYCGTRLRKRAPKLERRGDALEAKPQRRRRPRLRRAPRRRPDRDALRPFRPYAILVVILGSAVLLLLQKATGDAVSSFGGLVVPLEDEWWRYLTAPFAYTDVGYLFVGLARAGDLRHRARAAARHGAHRGAAGRLRHAGHAGGEQHRRRQPRRRP